MNILTKSSIRGPHLRKNTVETDFVLPLYSTPVPKTVGMQLFYLSNWCMMWYNFFVMLFNYSYIYISLHRPTTSIMSDNQVSCALSSMLCVAGSGSYIYYAYL